MGGLLAAMLYVRLLNTDQGGNNPELTAIVIGIAVGLGNKILATLVDLAKEKLTSRKQKP